MAKAKPKNLPATLRQVSPYFKRHTLSLAAVIVLSIVSALASVVGTYLLRPIINNYILPGNLQGLFGMLLVMGGLYLLGVLATYGYTQLMVRVAQGIVSELRNDLFKKMQTLPLSYFDSHTHGSLMSRFTNDIDTIVEALNNSFTVVVQSLVTVLGTFILLAVLSPFLSLFVLFSYFLMFLFLRFSGGKSHKAFTQQQQRMASLNGFVEEMVAGQKVVKVFNHEEENLEEFSRRNEQLRNSGTNAQTYSGMVIPVVVSISYLNYALSACVGGFLAISGAMDLGSLASYLVFVRQAALPLNQFSQQINIILAALAGAEHLFDVMNQPPEIDKGETTLSPGSECWNWQPPHSAPVALKGDVRFDNVVFGYKAGQPILKGISLYAKPGQKIAFVGSTGAGKTTIINLINRFYEINSGAITYDGIDTRQIKKDDLRHSLAVVLQDTHLFTGTIADNIRYGRLNATDEEVVSAAKLANADSFIRRLPNGYQTPLASDGGNLSQGQRQLLAIARAAVSNPPVLILDEATSSVDTYTEKMIEQGMDRLMEGRTVFVIAHRLSTVRNAKAIMVLENGNIIERGSHDELVAQKGRYYQLYTGQFELA